jgi:hypothetical protein
MRTFQDIVNILEFNGFNKESSLESVNDALSHLGCEDSFKGAILAELKLQGWFTDRKIEESVVDPEINNITQLDNQNLEIGNNSSKPLLVPQEKALPKKKSYKLVISIIFLLLLIGGGFLYAYIERIGPFSFSSYSEKTFCSSLLGKVGEIKSAAYSISGELAVVPRDADAEPFSIDESSEYLEMKKKYENDNRRSDDVYSIITQLNNIAGYNSYYMKEGSKPKKYLNNLKTIISEGIEYYSRYYSITDPLTGKDYEYQVNSDGSNFTLTIDFETDYAINAIKDYGYDENNTKIDGKRVSFTKDSDYFYMSSEMPKPFFMSLADGMKYMPSDFKVNTSIAISSEWGQEGADWTFNGGGELTSSDMSYKLNLDALKKDTNYYFKINNMPSLFSSYIEKIKGRWISISPNTSIEDGYSSYSYLKNGVLEGEKYMKENNEKFLKLITKMVALADEEKLFAFKNKPSLEKIDGRELVRYDLKLRKESILSFYTELQDELFKDPDFSENASKIADQGFIEYLKSEEFDKVFSYFDKNNTLTLWTDKAGFPAIIENNVRVVPPDAVESFKGKQVNLTFKIYLDNINKPLGIKAPLSSTPIDELDITE